MKVANLINDPTDYGPINLCLGLTTPMGKASNFEFTSQQMFRQVVSQQRIHYFVL